ncbi:MAG TPA: hypothetical protein PLV46_28975, partial [Reyranella sp.]|uniref:hypothetical protein n=1 Tax=Reyranella sp. TaxID=1929291 RepID=UPI002C59AEA8
MSDGTIWHSATDEGANSLGFTGSAKANMRLIRGSISRSDGLSSGRSPHRGEVHLGAPPKSGRRMPIGLGKEGDPQFLVPAVERR